MSGQQTCDQCGSQTSPFRDRVCEKCGPCDSPTIAPFAKRDTDADNDQTIAPASSVLNPIASPTDFGDYELLEEIARGGMGVVYKARHRKLNRVAAIKMILGGRFSSKDELQRFQVEAEAAAKLDHPNIVPVYESGEQGGQPFFAMKYISGGSLAEKIDKYRRDPRSAIELMKMAAKAVHHAHQRGILHRDLKPANILIDENDKPMITDLGLAKSTAGDSNLTNTGAVIGTPSYMSPEQASGQQFITTASDIFSLGAIMYELLTGRPPHKGATSIETAMSVINDEAQSPRKHNPQVDPELELICMKCIERNPEKRYGSAGAVADDLDNWLTGQPISIRAPSLRMLASRWMKNNKRLIYILFALFIGIAFSLPIIAAVFASESSNIGDAYQHFPESDRPFLFSLGKFPGWLPNLSMAILIFAIWPSIGWINAVVTKPKSIRGAFGVGIMTSLVCIFIVMAMMGWLLISLAVSSQSQDEIKKLSSAVWTPKDVTPEVAKATAEKMFTGLVAIPEDQRADIVTERIFADQIAATPVIVGIMLIVCGLLSVPVIMGTVIGYVLTNRDIPVWLAFIRYAITWLAATVFSVFAASLVFDGLINRRNFVERPITYCMILAISFLIAYLGIRRRKKQSGIPSGERKTGFPN